MVVVELHVPGAHCAVCRGAILDVLRAIPGVHDAALDLRTRVARVRIHPAAVDTGALCARLAAAGYPADVHEGRTPSDPSGGQARPNRPG